MRYFFKCAVKFLLALFVMTIINTIVWELYVDNKYYNDPGEGSADYLTPGD